MGILCCREGAIKPYGSMVTKALSSVPTPFTARASRIARRWRMKCEPFLKSTRDGHLLGLGDGCTEFPM
jgi:hypothetical protein